MNKICKEFKAKAESLFGQEYSHQPGGPCQHYVHPHGCKIDLQDTCETEGFKVIPRADQESDTEE